MHDYVILNEINSKNITGLMINILPPITKPPIRNEVEEIDGRDGDIVTKLGYGAYDKEVEIGLYGNYDIDEVIAFFNGEGNVVFSNEPDKYYKYQILEQIDYEKLLKFKTAVVIFHVQPFKFELDEEEIVNETPIITGNGSDITLEDTVDNNIISIGLSGNTHQDSYSGKNKFSTSIITFRFNNGVSHQIIDDNSIKITKTNTQANRASTWIIPNEDFLGKTFTLSYDYENSSTNINYIDITWLDKTTLTTVKYIGRALSGQPLTFTLDNNVPSDNSFLAIMFCPSDNSGGDTSSGVYTIFKNIQIEEGSATSYEPYCGGNPSPNPDYPQDIEVVTGYNEVEAIGKNLCNGINQGYYLNAAITLCGISSGDSGLVINVDGVSNYSISTKSLQQRYRVALLNTLPVGTATVIPSNGINKDGTNESITINTLGYKYLVINATTLNDIQIEKSEQVTPYELYQSQTYEVNLGAENLLNNTATTSTINGITFTVNDDKTVTVNGTSTAQTDFTIGYIDFKANTTYLLTGAPAGSGSNHYLSIRGYGNDTGDGRDYTPTEDTTKEIFLRIKSGISVNNVVIKPMVVKGTHKYNYVPYGVKPIEMCKIPNTDYKDEFRRSSGKNLFDKDNANVLNGLLAEGANKLDGNSNGRTLYISCNPNTIYTISKISSARFRVDERNAIPTINSTNVHLIVNDTATNITYTTSTNAKYLLLTYYFSNEDTTITEQQILNSIQIEQNTQATDLEPYGVGVWYKYGRIGKVVLDGSESGWEIKNTGTNNWYYQLINQILINAKTQDNQLSNYYPNAAIYNGNTNQGFYVGNSSDLSNRFIRIRYGTEDTIANYKNWLSTHNLIVYYPLLITSITTLNTELQTQLEDIYNNAKSYLGQTNITAEYVSGNQPFIMDVSVTGDSSVIVTNKGNTTAKPIFTLYGSGNIGIYLNGNQLFNVSLGDEEYITFDIENMNAYKDTILKNRLVTGNYSNFLLNPGENKISFSGDVSKFEIINYSRWL